MSAATIRQRLDDCKPDLHAQALRTLGPRAVDLRPFVVACLELVGQLERIGENREDDDREQERLTLIAAIDGVVEALECGESMIPSF